VVSFVGVRQVHAPDLAELCAEAERLDRAAREEHLKILREREKVMEQIHAWDW
jgi:hypothetical protein